MAQPAWVGLSWFHAPYINSSQCFRGSPCVWREAIWEKSRRHHTGTGPQASLRSTRDSGREHLLVCFGLWLWENSKIRRFISIIVLLITFTHHQMWLAGKCPINDGYEPFSETPQKRKGWFGHFATCDQQNNPRGHSPFPPRVFDFFWWDLQRSKRWNVWFSYLDMPEFTSWACI